MATFEVEGEDALPPPELAAAANGQDANGGTASWMRTDFAGPGADGAESPGQRRKDFDSTLGAAAAAGAPPTADPASEDTRTFTEKLVPCLVNFALYTFNTVSFLVCSTIVLGQVAAFQEFDFASPELIVLGGK